jgi:hypothetical protein
MTHGPADPAARPIVFLLGPPGAGKTSLGSRACKELGLRFFDLAGAPADAAGDDRGAPDRERLSGLVAEHTADVVELPWPLQQERETLGLARRSGVSLLLWAHPEDMQARSGRAEPLFTPVPRLELRGGFGRRGTRCPEFRRLDRACTETLLLVDLPFDEAAEVVKDCIAQIREESSASPAEREGLAVWEEAWRCDHGANARVVRVILDAMARYLVHLRAEGASPRTLSDLRSDLDAAGRLVLMYDTPRGKRILGYFDGPPWEHEFECKFTDRPALVARYRRNLEGFAGFLRRCGDLPADDDSPRVR